MSDMDPPLTLSVTACTASAIPTNPARIGQLEKSRDPLLGFWIGFSRTEYGT